MWNDARGNRPTVTTLALVGSAALWLLGAVPTARASDPAFSAEERRRLAQITPLPAEGELTAARIAGVTFATISPKKLPDFGEADCRALGRLPKLSDVTLDDLPLSAACVDALPRTSMSLRLVGVGFAPDTLAALGRMPGLANLRIEGGKGLTARLVDAVPPTSRLVRLTAGEVDGETLTALRRLPRLTELEIERSVGGQGLAPLEGAPDLERLVVGTVTGADLAVIAGLPKLSELSIGVDAGVGEGGLRLLATSKTLKTVSLSFEAGAAGVGVLAEMPHLEHLRLVYQTVPDRELERLARSRTLTALDLREAEVTEAGLASLLKSGSLKSVNLWRVSVSDKLRRRLAKKFQLE